MSSQPVARKRHPVRRIVIAIIVVAVLVAAFFVGDAIARAYATNYIREQVASSLGLSSDAPVSADLGSGSVLLQAASGHLNNVNVMIDPLTIAGLSGAATMKATDVPLDQTQPTKTVTLAVTVPATTVTKAIAQIPTIQALKPTVSIVDDKIDVTATANVFGIQVPIGLVVVPGVTSGHPTFTVESVKASGATIPIKTLNTYVPGISEVLSTGTSLCIANALPEQFSLTSVTLTKTSLVYTLSAQNVPLNSTALSKKGTCSK